MYNGPVIDTHHHIWLRKDVGWLADPPIPRMFGDYFGIRRDYPVEEFINDVKPQGVTKSVHVTAMWGPGKALEETRWLQSVADKHGFPHGIVSNIDLADPGAETALKAQKQFPNLRGVRQMLYWDTDPVRQGALRADFCNSPDFRRGFALLEKHGLHFELQVYAGQVNHAVELIKAFPGVKMILVLGAHVDGAVSQPACEDFRTRDVQQRHHLAAGTAGDPRRHPDLWRRAHHLWQQLSARKVACKLCRLLQHLSSGLVGISRN
jgi:predicted TIM-barrel fold metal-dependent hydrolase